jgi:hypothetical protein
LAARAGCHATGYDAEALARIVAALAVLIVIARRRGRGAARIVAVLAVLIASRSTPRPWPRWSPPWRRCSSSARRQGRGRIVAALAALFARLDAEAVVLIVAALAPLIAGRSTPRPWRGPDRRRPGGAVRHRLDAEAVARPGSSPPWRC